MPSSASASEASEGEPESEAASEEPSSSESSASESEEEEAPAVKKRQAAAAVPQRPPPKRAQAAPQAARAAVAARAPAAAAAAARPLPQAPVRLPAALPARLPPARAPAKPARHDADGDSGSSSAPEASESDGEESEFEVPGSDTDEEASALCKQQLRKAANVKAMQSGQPLNVTRASVLPKLLTVTDVETLLRRPFKCPSGAAGPSSELMHRLQMQRVFVPWGSKAVALPTMAPRAPPPGEEALPPGVEPLQLWPFEDSGAPEDAKPILVDNMLVKWLRPHQRQGVQFMFECIMDLRKFGGCGCILADDMGLGKTLQAITILWTLLCQGYDGTPIARRVIIVCPTSLVSNWDAECEKWLKGRVKTTPIAESTRADVIQSIALFLSPRSKSQVLIVSYETFRLHSERFAAPSACDLLICDEAHRLKNDETLTNKALDSLACRRRILLSGTPIQNHLDEFFSMVNFANPGVLGSHSEFHKKFERPILAGREPDASDAEQKVGSERGLELSGAVDRFILRRTNTILSAHLPPKVIQIVCCLLSPLQTACYESVLSSKVAKQIQHGKETRVLNVIQDLKKLCNHPKLIYDTAVSKKACDGFQECVQFFQPGMFDDGRMGRGQPAPGWERYGGKFEVLVRLMEYLRTHTTDRIVLVSNYTQTLDLFATLCREKRYPSLRLDGSVTISKRQQLVKRFNDPHDNQFAFLLSSKAGGCGLNLIGGNRLVLFDPDWNPANDKQAAGRVWRDGQKKRVFVYRFLATGTIDEKVYQRQLSKEGLQNLVDAKGKVDMAMMSRDDLRKLFTLTVCPSDTHDNLKCKRCPKPAPPVEEPVAEAAAAAAAAAPVEKKAPTVDPRRWLHQNGKPAEDDLMNWGHHLGTAEVPDEALKYAGADGQVSFVFVCKVEGKDVTDEPPISAAQSAAQRGGAAGPSTMRAPGARGGPPAGGGGAGPRPALAPLQSKAPAPAPRPVPAAAHQAAAPKVAPARTPVPARRPDLAPAGAPASRPSPAAAAAPPVVKRIHQPSGGASAPPHPPRAATPVLISVPDSDVEMEEEEQQAPATLAASELVRSEGASAKRPKHDAPTLSPLARPVSDQAPVAVFVKKSRLQSASSGGRAVPVAAAPLVAVPPGAPANFYTPARDEDDDFVA